MPDFGIFRGFGSKLFSDKLYAGQLPTQLGLIGSDSFGYVYLLDDYPSAAAAYSLRKLRSAYTGSAIRVRRASNNAEQDIGFVNNVIDTSSLTSFCSGTNGFITTWYDQSGNGNNAIQSTAANQPQIVSSGSVILDNSKPSLLFDGSNDRLGFTEINGVTGLSLITVSNYSRISNDSTIFNASDVIIAYTGGFIKDMSIGARQNKSQIYYEDGTSKFIAGLSISTNTQYLQLGYVSTNGAGISTNGNLTTGTAGLNNSIVRSIAQDFSSVYFQGKIAECIVYPTDQSSNRTGIETNINDFYSIY